MLIAWQNCLCVCVCVCVCARVRARVCSCARLSFSCCSLYTAFVVVYLVLQLCIMLCGLPAVEHATCSCKGFINQYWQLSLLQQFHWTLRGFVLHVIIVWYNSAKVHSTCFLGGHS